MEISSRCAATLQRLDESICDDWIATLLKIGEDPSTFFEDSDWTGVDFSMSDMRGISFRGSILDRSIFRHGHLSHSQRESARSANGVVEVSEATGLSSGTRHAHLHQHRPEVRMAVESLTTGKSVIMLGPIGSGKSTCFELVTKKAPHVWIIGKVNRSKHSGLAGIFLDVSLQRGWPGINPSLVTRYESQVSFLRSDDYSRAKSDREFIASLVDALAMTYPAGCALAIEDAQQLNANDMKILIRTANRSRVRLLLAADSNHFRLIDYPALALEIRKGKFALIDLAPPSSDEIADLFAALKFPDDDSKVISSAIEGIGFAAAMRIATRVRHMGLDRSIAGLMLEVVSALPTSGVGFPESGFQAAKILDWVSEHKQIDLEDDGPFSDGLASPTTVADFLNYFVLRGVFRFDSEKNTYAFSIAAFERIWRDLRMKRENSTIQSHRGWPMA